MGAGHALQHTTSRGVKNRLVQPVVTPAISRKTQLWDPAARISMFSIYGYNHYNSLFTHVRCCLCFYYVPLAPINCAFQCCLIGQCTVAIFAYAYVSRCTPTCALPDPAYSLTSTDGTL